MAREQARQGEYFKFEDHQDASGILIKILRYVPDAPGGYQGARTDSYFCDLTVFATEADFAEGGEPASYKNVRIDKTFLVSNLAEAEAEGADELIRRLERGTKGGKPWFFRWPEESVRAGIWEWVDAREEAIDALASSESVPDYLK